MEENAEDDKEERGEGEGSETERKRKEVLPRGDVEGGGGGQHHDKAKKLKQFQKEEGKTPGCIRCQNP